MSDSPELSSVACGRLSPGRGRRAALIGGLGVAGVLLLAVLSWRDLAVRYQVHRLRQEPDHLLAIFESPEGSIEAEAVKKFLAAGPFPGEAVFRAYLSDLGKLQAKPHVDPTREEVSLSIDSRGSQRVSWVSILPTTRGGGSMLIPGADVPRLRVLQDLLARHGYTSREVSAYAGAVFSFHRKGERFPEDSAFRDEDPPSGAYCLIRRKGPVVGRE